MRHEEHTYMHPFKISDTPAIELCCANKESTRREEQGFQVLHLKQPWSGSRRMCVYVAYLPHLHIRSSAVRLYSLSVIDLEDRGWSMFCPVDIHQPRIKDGRRAWIERAASARKEARRDLRRLGTQ
jgi:hypothetical protein